LGRPQLKSPPEPVMFTPPFTQAAPAGPEFAQSTEPPPPANRMLPSTFSHPDGAAITSMATAAPRKAAIPAHASVSQRCFLNVTP
jgi:hypothetical protein